MSGPIPRGLTTLSPSVVGTATKVTVDQYGRVIELKSLTSGDIPWDVPGTIGSTTPNTGAFTTVAIGGPAVTELTVFTTSTSDPRGIMSGQYSTDTLGSRVHLRKARGTVSVRSEERRVGKECRT